MAKLNTSIRKYSFSNRVVDVLELPAGYCNHAEIVFFFETRLDNYWIDQAILHEYESKINFNYKIILKTRSSSWCHRLTHVAKLPLEVNLCKPM